MAFGYLQSLIIHLMIFKKKLWENKKYTFLKSMSVSILSPQTSDFLPNKDKTGVDPTWHAI